MALKRNEVLAQLSRDHHLALLMAQVLKSNGPKYAGTERDAQSRKVYVQDFYRDKLKEHFREEEQILFPMAEKLSAEIKLLQTELMKEHRIMEELLLTLESSSNLESTLNELGFLLDDHVRKEERKLFEWIQQHADENWFSNLKSKLRL